MRGTRAASAVVLLLAGASAFAQEPPPAPAPAPKPPAPAAPTIEEDRAQLEKLVGQAVPIVEKLRGLKFAKSVPVAPVTAAQFVDKYERDFTKVLGGAGNASSASRLLIRLRILGEGDDIRALLGRYLEGSIAANYDPETGGVSFLPRARRTLPLMVHELTHALDDQHFDMKAQIATWRGNLDRALAYGALAEGDAQSVEVRLMTGGASGKQPLADLRRMADAFADSVLKGKFGAAPPVLVLAFRSQYIEGSIFAETLRRTEKGEEAVNAAFRAPPDSTEQILHPEKFLARETPVVLDLPDPGEGKTEFVTTLGELGTRLVLLANGREPKAATTAAAGWAGDTAALVAFPAGEAFLWTSAWDTEADATEFHDALKAALPLQSGDGTPLKEGEPEPPLRMLVQRGTTVEFVEAPLDAMPAAVKMAKAAKRR